MSHENYLIQFYNLPSASIGYIKFNSKFKIRWDFLEHGILGIFRGIKYNFDLHFAITNQFWKVQHVLCQLAHLN